MSKPIGSQIHQTGNCIDAYIEYHLSKYPEFVNCTPMENFTLRFAYEHFSTNVFYAQDLMKLTILSKATTSQTLNSLQHKGFIEMKALDCDKRRKSIRITENGIKLINALAKVFEEISNVIELNLTSQDKENLERMLSIIRDNVNNAKK